MLIPAQTAQILLLVALAAIAVLTVLVVAMGVRLRRLRRGYRTATDGTAGGGLFESVERQHHQIEDLKARLQTLGDDVEGIRALQAAAVSRVAVLRYDAFDDMGGALSFSVALLDEHGSGLVLSAINGRSETRCYAKAVERGDSQHTLSTEEREALRAALDTDGREVAVSTRRRRPVS